MDASKEISFNSPPSTLICSNFGSISINEDRNLISFGKNEGGSLGHENFGEIIYPPKQIPNLMNIKMVDCGYYHTVCIDYDGNLFVFGNNDKGQLGVGKNNNELPFTHIPQKVIDIPPIDFISCGNYFTICITIDNLVYAFGDNKNGQLGIVNCTSMPSPQLIPDLKNIQFIQCGGNHAICKTYSNEYYSWGNNYSGQLGQGNYDYCNNKPHKCSNWPDNIINIKCGNLHSLLLTSKGYVYSFGDNTYGKLGLSDETIKSINIPRLIKDLPLIKRIECGDYHSICIDINDKLWVFGNNEYGQLGLGDTENRYKPTLNESLQDIINISSVGYHTFVKTINNKIYAFGINNDSQFGIKTSERHQLIPIQVFKDNEDIWVSNTGRSKQKSARK